MLAALSTLMLCALVTSTHSVTYVFGCIVLNININNTTQQLLQAMPCQMARDMLSARLYLSDVRCRSGHGQYSQAPCLAYPEPAATAALPTDTDDNSAVKVCAFPVECIVH